MSTAASQSVSRRLRQYEMAERLGQVGHWYWRIGAETVVLSPEAYRIFGQSADDFEATHRNLLGLYSGESAKTVSDALTDAVAKRKSLEFQAEIQRDGRLATIHVIADCEIGVNNQVQAIFGVVKDITAQLHAGRDLARANQRQRDFAEMASDWLWEMGPDLKFTYVSDRIEQTLGMKVVDIIGRSRRDLTNEADLDATMREHLATLDRREPFRDFRYWRTTPDGSRTFMSTSGKPIFGPDGDFKGYRGSARDVTTEELAREALLNANRNLVSANRAKSDAVASLQEANRMLEARAEEMARVQAEIQHTALHDPLTKIANRRYLDERLTELASMCRRDGRWLAALHVDLDRFKQINDTAGHAAGDALLVHVAGILKASVRAEDFVARIGGDEFVVLCFGDTDITEVGEIAERIIARVGEPFDFEGRECWSGASVGIATTQGDIIAPNELLANADIALYRAKNQGRGCFEYFNAGIQAEIMANQRIADGIRAGMPRGEFVPFFQPQICARTYRIAGFEALVRWRHPEDGVLPPSSFLKIAEDLGTVATLDRMILEAALQDYRNWTASGLEIPRLSVNVSARRLSDPDLTVGLRDLNLPRGVISFELLESVFLDEVDDRMGWNIDNLRELGIEIELDDFGSGHASIVSLLRLGPDAIKIDRELTATIAIDRTRRNLVKSIIEIGKSLDVRVVAEGVENEAQARLLSAMGCDMLQGFLFSRPLDAADIPGFILGWDDIRARAAF
ncbi:MAG: EAL domain-containing protein [Pseudomonadota bacterium]